MVARLLAALARIFTRRRRDTATAEPTAQPDVPTRDVAEPDPPPVTPPTADLDEVYRLVDTYPRGHLTWEQVQAQIHGTDRDPR